MDDYDEPQLARDGFNDDMNFDPLNLPPKVELKKDNDSDIVKTQRESKSTYHSSFNPNL